MYLCHSENPLCLKCRAERPFDIISASTSIFFLNMHVIKLSTKSQTEKKLGKVRFLLTWEDFNSALLCFMIPFVT